MVAVDGKNVVATTPSRDGQQPRPLEGRVALVTGASRGIGRAIALELAGAGARLGLNNRSGEAQVRPLIDEIERLGSTALHVRADVSNPRDARDMVRRVLDEFGRIDILVNNAGITRDRTLRKMADAEWLEVINTNLNSVFFCTSAAVPAMIEQNYGRIINISSVIGQAGGFGQTNYAAAKGGIIAFTKAAALELAKYNITVNAIAPGFTATDMVQAIPPNVQEQIKGRIPLGRFAQPEEIARVVRLLAADGDYITGQQFNVNGGLYM